MAATKAPPPTPAPVISCLRGDWATYQKQPGKPDPNFPYPAHPPKGPKNGAPS